MPIAACSSRCDKQQNHLQLRTTVLGEKKKKKGGWEEGDFPPKVSSVYSMRGWEPVAFTSSDPLQCVHSKLLQLCPTLCNPMDCSLPGSSFHGILQQECWSGLPCPPPGDLPDPGIEPTTLLSPALAGRFFTPSTTWEAQFLTQVVFLKL